MIVPEIHNDSGRIRQNLIDAGCGPQMIESCMDDFTAGAPGKMLPKLARHRRTLLEALHREQKQIDCLDYLVYLNPLCITNSPIR